MTSTVAVREMARALSATMPSIRVTARIGTSCACAAIAASTPNRIASSA